MPDLATVDRPALVTAEDRYPVPGGGHARTPAEAVVDRFWRHHERPGHPLKGRWPAGVHPTLTAQAYVSHGRWVVDCPHGCGSAQYASHSDLRFFCADCGNQGTGEWVTVEWPADRDGIEAELLLRPDPATRNWRPGETVEQLAAENVERGLKH